MATSRHVVLVFLAHDGITQPKVWELWHNMCSFRDNLKFFVHCPIDKVPESTLFNRLDLSFGNTAWCQPSLVFEHLRAIKKTMQTLHFNSETECLYCLVSGTDIPLRNADCLFNCKYETMIRMLYPQYWNYVGYPSYSHLKHSQWMVLASSEANIIINECIKDDYSATSEFKKYVMDILCYSQGFKSCPDETIIGRILFDKMQNGVPVNMNVQALNNIITWDARAIRDSYPWLQAGSYHNSPIEWYSPDVVVPVNVNNFPGMELDEETIQPRLEVGFSRYHRYSHYCAMLCYFNLQHDSKNPTNTLPGGVFFRKVTRDMPFESLEYLYRLLFSGNNPEIVKELNKQNVRTHTLELGLKARYLKANPLIMDFGSLCIGRLESFNDAIFKYNDEKVDEFIRNNWTLLDIQRAGNGKLKFKINKDKYIININDDKYTILKNKKYMTSNDVKLLIKDIKETFK